MILRTLTGELTIAEASEQLGIKQARFNDIRRQALKAAVADLEPRRPGRPAKQPDPQAEELATLQSRVVELEQELKVSEVRTELALALPALTNPARKKTKQISARKQRRAERKRRRKLRKPK